MRFLEMLRFSGWAFPVAVKPAAVLIPPSLTPLMQSAVPNAAYPPEIQPEVVEGPNNTVSADTSIPTSAHIAARSMVLSTLANDTDRHQLMGRAGSETCGRCTNYDVGLGSCGDTDTNADWLLALPLVTWGSPCCHRMVSIVGEGITRQAPVKDCCPGCSAESTPPEDTYLPVADLSPALFGQFANADNSVGPGWFACCWYYS